MEYVPSYCGGLADKASSVASAVLMHISIAGLCKQPNIIPKYIATTTYIYIIISLPSPTPSPPSPHQKGCLPKHRQFTHFATVRILHRPAPEMPFIFLKKCIDGSVLHSFDDPIFIFFVSVPQPQRAPTTKGTLHPRAWARLVVWHLARWTAS